MVTFNSSMNRVAEEKDDSILLILLFALISEKVVLIVKPVFVLNLSSKTCILLMVEVVSNCSLGTMVNKCFPSLL